MNENELSFYDGLTGLIQRKNFDNYLKNEYFRCKRCKSIFSVIMLDIDFFKKVNDTYGHYSGDIVLKRISYKLKELVRGSDIVARYGGEEMVILLPEIGSKDIFHFMERIRKNIENIDLSDISNNLKVTVSLGSSTFHYIKNNVLPDVLLKQADEMLYKAKKNGRNRYYHYKIS